jgi:hypothetical protein
MHSNRREGRCCVRWCDREVRCTRERLGATQSPPFGERSQAFLVARNPRKFGYHEQGIARRFRSMVWAPTMGTPMSLWMAG